MPQASDGEERMGDWPWFPAEAILVGGNRGPARLGFAVVLTCFQRAGRFPPRPQDVPPTVVAPLAAPVGLPPEPWSADDGDGRTIISHRAEMRPCLGFREATIADQAALGTWLTVQVRPTTVRSDAILAAADERLRD
jgi:hypothetical protein